MSDLRSIIYVSTAVHEMSEPELEALLAECRALNLETQVTGMLLYSAGGFMQCFEGAHDAVDVTYQRILASKKHHGVIELADDQVDERSFPDFQMGFVHAARSDSLRLSTQIWERRVASRSTAQAAHVGVALLDAFWNQARRLV